MEPSLVVIGVSARTAPVAVRERFFLDEIGLRHVLDQLARAEGVNELAVVSSCERSEFIVWARDATIAANSVLNCLTRDYRMRSSEWKHFYRFVDERAVLHLMRVAAGLDSAAAADPEVLIHVRDAWMRARASGSCGPVLDAVFEDVLAAGERVRQETGLGAATISVASAMVELARQIFGALDNRRITLIGAGRLAVRVAQRLVGAGGQSVRVLNRSENHAAGLAMSFGFDASAMQARPECLAEADVVISTVPASESALTRFEIETACRDRNGRPLLLIDAGVPRNIDPAVRDIPGVFLYDIDNLHELMNRGHCYPSHGPAQDAPHPRSSGAGLPEAEKLIATAASRFCSKLEPQRIVPIVVALRRKLDEICRQELESLRHESGPFAEAQVLETLACRISQSVAGFLARELKHPDRLEQERLTEAVQRLFRLQAEPAPGGARS